MGLYNLQINESYTGGRLEETTGMSSCEAQIPLGLSRHASDTFNVDKRVEHVEPCCSNMADDE